MKKLLAIATLALLAACQSAPKLEDDTRYTRLAKVVDVHVYSETERKEAAKSEPRPSSGVGMGVGIGFGTGGSFGGIMFGGGTGMGGGRSNGHPLVSKGANRYTVQPLNTSDKVEVNSYGKYKAGDCVKLFSGHPSEYARLFDLKSGESCQ